MNSKNKSANAQKKITLTRKEWRKSVRAAARLKRREAKKAAEEKNNATPKRYNMLVQYHPTLNNKVREIIEKNKIRYAILTNVYFVVTDLSDGACKEIEEAFKSCIQPSVKARIPKNIKFSRWIPKEVPEKKERTRRASNNTDEAKLKAKKRRKVKHLLNFGNRNKHTKSGKSSKRIAFRRKMANNMSLAKFKRKKEREKNITTKAKLVKPEVHKIFVQKKTKNCKKAVQQKFNFAA